MALAAVHPFPARMAPDIAIDHLDSLPACSNLLMLDPMCGSGTALCAAASRGHTALGFDVDPLAVLISTVATQPVPVEAVKEEAAHVIRNASSSRESRPLWADQETIRFAEYWFGDTQRVQLNRLARELANVPDDCVRQVLQVALSRIIITKSPQASLAADTSHSRPHRVMLASSYDVYKGFEKSTAKLAQRLKMDEYAGRVTVRRGDARKLALADGSVDLIITSPPYLNAIDYLRGHKMSLIWLGHTIGELRKIRAESIGSERALEGDSAEHIRAMVEMIKDSAQDASKLPLATIHRFAHDVDRFSRELYRVCKRGAQVVTVIGNSTLRGNYIKNDVLVRDAFQAAGFEVRKRAERELPENKRYLPVRTTNEASSMARRMRSEVVLTVEKV